MMRYILIIIAIFQFIKGDAAGISGISYELSMPDPQKHYFQVKINIHNPSGEFLDMKMPVWAPGSYLIREFARNVEYFNATKDNGEGLRFQKINKNTWRIFLRPSGNITITYKVYAFDLSVRTSYLDRDHGYVNGTSVFMYCEEGRDLPVTLAIIPDPEFRKISTALPLDTERNLYHAKNYDQLADCPIEIGNHRVISFEIDGVLHEMAMYGKGNYEGREAMIIRDISDIVQAFNRIFGENPNDYYLFIVHNIDKGGGALEHENSSTLQVNRWIYDPQSSYMDFLSLVAHEYFHIWNVKRIKPETFIPYDYDQEMYTDLLWMFEGFTSYYDDIILKRLGYLTEDQYIRKLNGAINSIERNPGISVQPVAMASFDAWIKYYRSDENSINSSVSYYTKGNVIAAMLDISIIHYSGGKYSLDNVMNTLYKDYYLRNKGINAGDLKSVIERFTGTGLDDFFNEYINGTETLEYNKFLDYAGFNIYNLNNLNTDPFLGAGITIESGKARVSTVIRGTSAHETGLSAGDEIIAIDGFQVDGSDIFKMIGRYKTGDTLNITISRHGMLDTRKLQLQPDPRPQYNIYPGDAPDDSQMTVRKKWLKGTIRD